MTFQIGDRVRCVDPIDNLKLGKVYTVKAGGYTELVAIDGHEGVYFTRRFVSENSDIPKEKKPTIVLNAKAKSTVPHFRNWIVWRKINECAPDRCLSDETPVIDALFYRLRNMWEKDQISKHSTSLDFAFSWSTTKEGGEFWLCLNRYLHDEIGEDEVPWDLLEN